MAIEFEEISPGIDFSYKKSAVGFSAICINPEITFSSILGAISFAAIIPGITFGVTPVSAEAYYWVTEDGDYFVTEDGDWIRV